jgi:hypothetical protein
MLTKITGTGTGAAPVVNLTFPFLAQADVKAAVDGVSAAISFTGASQVTFSAPVANGAKWVVYRETPKGDPKVVYSDGAILKDSSLNLSQTQQLYIAQENADAVEAGSKTDVTVGAGGIRWKLTAGAVDATALADGSVTTNKLGAGAVTLSKMANLAAGTILGNNGGGAAAPLALTPAQVTAMLDLATAAAKGLAPQLPNDTTKFLRGDGTYAVPPVNTGPQGPPGDVSRVASRAALAAETTAGPTAKLARYLSEDRREGMFTAQAAAGFAALIAADPQQAVYVQSTSDPSVVWVRDGASLEVRPEWFGAAGDGVTDDYNAFVAMRTYLIAARSTESVGPRSVPVIRLSRATYLLGSSFSLKGFTSVWRGVGSGMFHLPTGSIIKMASDKTFYIDRADTEGGTTGTAIDNVGGDYSEFHNLGFMGPGQGVGAAPVVWARANFRFHNVTVTKGGSHGLQVLATSGAGTTLEGNANGWLWVGGSASMNGGSGIYTSGADANAGTAVGVSFDNNSRYGTEEESFLGNYYYGCHWDANALGHLHGTGLNNGSEFRGYFEEGFTTSTIPPRASTNYWNISGAALTAGDGFVAMAPGYQINVIDGTKNLILKRGFGGRAVATNPLVDEFNYTDFGAFPVTSYFIAGSGAYVPFGVGYSTTGRVASLNGTTGTRYMHGLTAAPDLAFGLRALYLGDGVNPEGRRFIVASAAPATGEHAQGEFAFNTGITAGTPLFAWATTVGGTPGTQTPLYALTATPAAIATSGSGADLANSTVTLGKIANIADQTILGNNVGSAGAPVALTAAQVRTVLGLASVATSGSAADLTTGSLPAARIANATLTYAMHANTAASKLLGNPTGGAAAMSEIGLAGGLTFSGSNLTVGALTPTSVAATGAITSSGATNGVGYATGAGGAVTQTTSKSNGVTLNKAAGQITMNNAALAAAAVVSFTVTNSAVAATDTINVNLQSGNATAGTYRYWVDKVSAGSFVLAVENRSGGSLSEALVFNFAVLKAVNA